MTVRQITIRNPEPELTERLKSLAVERGESLNTTILRLLSEAVGLDARRRRFERLATWTEAEAAEFDAALGLQRAVDPELW